MIDYIHDLKIGDLIRYNFLYSNEEEKLGIVYKIKKDLNFSAMVYVIGEKTTDVIPYSIMEYKVLDRKN
jgi:hypothetical protein|tara:strand:+ start:874 stop:1080 length:207 start_codon:yes stop_codon:yes gene_type:complete